MYTVDNEHVFFFKQNYSLYLAKAHDEVFQVEYNVWSALFQILLSYNVFCKAV